MRSFIHRLFIFHIQNGHYILVAADSYDEAEMTVCAYIKMSSIYCFSEIKEWEFQHYDGVYEKMLEGTKGILFVR